MFNGLLDLSLVLIHLHNTCTCIALHTKNIVIFTLNW